MKVFQHPQYAPFDHNATVFKTACTLTTDASPSPIVSYRCRKASTSATTRLGCVSLLESPIPARKTCRYRLESSIHHQCRMPKDQTPATSMLETLKFLSRILTMFCDPTGNHGTCVRCLSERSSTTALLHISHQYTTTEDSHHANTTGQAIAGTQPRQHLPGSTNAPTNTPPPVTTRHAL